MIIWDNFLVSYFSVCFSSPQVQQFPQTRSKTGSRHILASVLHKNVNNCNSNIKILRAYVQLKWKRFQCGPTPFMGGVSIKYNTATVILTYFLLDFD